VEATVDVAAWLKNLGLGQYEKSFRDNAIEGDVLPTLTAEVKDLGVNIVGHRRKLLDAIAALGAGSSRSRRGYTASLPRHLNDPHHRRAFGAMVARSQLGKCGLERSSSRNSRKMDCDDIFPAHSLRRTATGAACRPHCG
jgi:hypothetical protein